VALLALAVFLAWTRRSRADVLLAAAGMQVFFYAAAPVFSTWQDAALHSASSFERLSLALGPLAFLAVGARLAGVSPRTANASEPDVFGDGLQCVDEEPDVLRKRPAHGIRSARDVGSVDRPRERLLLQAFEH